MLVLHLTVVLMVPPAMRSEAGTINRGEIDLGNFYEPHGDQTFGRTVRRDRANPPMRPPSSEQWKPTRFVCLRMHAMRCHEEPREFNVVCVAILKPSL